MSKEELMELVRDVFGEFSHCSIGPTHTGWSVMTSNSDASIQMEFTSTRNEEGAISIAEFVLKNLMAGLPPR